MGGREFTLEFSKLAEQANAAVIGKYGDTIVLATVVMGKKDKAMDYFPLSVDYEEKFYAAGKIIGSRYVRREGRPSEEAVLSGRLIDRSIRPLFDHRVRRDIQIVTTVLAFDEENDPDTIALVAASAALATSNIPWNGPVSGLKIAEINGELVVNPTMSSLKGNTASFETFVSGTESRINMIEFAGLNVKEETAKKAFELAQSELKKLNEFQKKIAEEIGQPKSEVTLVEPNPELKAELKTFLADKLEEAIYTKEKNDRESKIGILKSALKQHLLEKNFEESLLHFVDTLFDEEIDLLLHRNILGKESRPDGRKLDELRELHSMVALFERTHGSAIFMRGNTQALAITTLGAPGQEQLIETMETTAKRRFLLHYNFPHFSVGETGPFRGPGRREIGHGALAEKAVRPLIPPQSEFPYTVRVVSEILSSNGSSSMATVSATILSLMDAGVPIKKAAAGIAMGLIVDDAMAESPRYKVLTDIQGPEDHHGDMDFKIAGTDEGVNAIQLDVKINGLTIQMIEATLLQAKKARLEILANMAKAIPAPRPMISKYAPVIRSLLIDPSKIGGVIGSGGKVINGIIEKTGTTTIDIEDDGRVFVTGPTLESVEKAVYEIEQIVREFKVGEIIEGNVIKILDFGAIVDLGGGRDGMIHVSELKNGFVKKVEEVVKLGDFVRAKVVRVEDGKIGLSIKQL